MTEHSFEKQIAEKADFVRDIAQKSGQDPSLVHAVLHALEFSIVQSLNNDAPCSFTFPGLFCLNSTRVRAGTLVDEHPFTKKQGLFFVEPQKMEMSIQWLHGFSAVYIRDLAQPRSRRRVKQE